MTDVCNVEAHVGTLNLNGPTNPTVSQTIRATDQEAYPNSFDCAVTVFAGTGYRIAFYLNAYSTESGADFIKVCVTACALARPWTA
jgi:hypothetical protein